MWALYQKLGYCINFTVSISSDPSSPFSAKACGHCCHFVCCRGTQIQGQHAARTNNQMRHVDWHVFNPAFAKISCRSNHITWAKPFCICLDEPVQRCVFAETRTLDLHRAYLYSVAEKKVYLHRTLGMFRILNPTFHVRMKNYRVCWGLDQRSSLHFCFRRISEAA